MIDVDGLVVEGLVIEADDAEDAPVDGRTARSERTRTAIVDALLSLLEEGDVLPTAPRIAERAGISLRLIYHHFGDLESLFRAVSRRQVQRMSTLFAPIDVGLPLPDRIDALVQKRARINESMTPVRRASVLQEPFSQYLAATRDAGFLFSQDEIEQVFAAELASLADEDRRTLVSALQGVLGWGAWNDLRLSGRTEDEAAASVHLVLRRLLMEPA